MGTEQRAGHAKASGNLERIPDIRPAFGLGGFENRGARLSIPNKSLAPDEKAVEWNASCFTATGRLEELGI